jgi:hypothetical protein
MEPTRWATTFPALHMLFGHRSQSFDLVDSVTENDEVVLACFGCGMTWHTNLRDTEDEYQRTELLARANRIMRASFRGIRPVVQLALPLEVPPLRTERPEREKREYRVHRYDGAAQMSLPLAA